MGRLRRLIFGISVGEASFSRRGFRSVDVPARERLERSAATFLTGYRVRFIV